MFFLAEFNGNRINYFVLTRRLGSLIPGRADFEVQSFVEAAMHLAIICIIDVEKTSNVFFFFLHAEPISGGMFSPLTVLDFPSFTSLSQCRNTMFLEGIKNKKIRLLLEATELQPM